jgi:hypothetical protein
MRNRAEVVRQIEKEYGISLMPAFRAYEAIKEANKNRPPGEDLAVKSNDEGQAKCPFEDDGFGKGAVWGYNTCG